MDEMESKLNAILSNPEMMQQIMTMAQSLGGSGGEQKQEPPQKQQPSQPPKQQSSQMHKQQPSQQQMAPVSPANSGMDLATIQKIMGLSQKCVIDQNQRALLRALQPFLSKDRIMKLERAMRAAKLAAAAGFAFGGQNQQGR